MRSQSNPSDPAGHRYSSVEPIGAGVLGQTPLLLQGRQGFTDCTLADAVGSDQFVLRRHSITGTVVSLIQGLGENLQ